MIEGDHMMQYSRLWDYGETLRSKNPGTSVVICTERLSIDHPHLLSAVSRDGNDNMFPIVVAVVEAETKQSWMWFMKSLLDDIGGVEQKGWKRSYITVDERKTVKWVLIGTRTGSTGLEALLLNDEARSNEGARSNDEAKPDQISSIHDRNKSRCSEFKLSNF
ncbi:hypothetical protein RJ639_033312 [Escallonia herrerae]|uniref:MULE transposase domain-containing protein n=1 Tax=Escallonia herrerae TaxID=1293975 RepID=A0AA88WUT1_9ASTE|nr:hypothetical protein RJ639_033312 [Escallonia herrerae]